MPDRPDTTAMRARRASVALGLLLAIALLSLSVPPRAAATGLITSFTAGVLNDENTANPQASDYFTQAGGHPDAAFTKFTINTSDSAVEFVRVDLPAGLAVNPQAIPRCSAATVTSCPSDTQVGKTTVTISNIPVLGNQTVTGNVYNMTPSAGSPSDFAFEVTVGALLPIRTDLVGGVRYYPSNGRPADFGDYFTISNISNLLGTKLEKSELLFWGAPEEHNGGGAADNAFITDPSTCNGPETTFISASTYSPVSTGSTSYTTPVGATGCDKEPFAPTISVTPATTQRDKPDGLAVDLHVPQDQNPAHIAPSQLRESTVTMPAGLTLDPSAAVGLQACTDAQFKAATNEALACPGASLIGTAEILTPVLGVPLTGSLYAGQPLSSEPGSGQEYRVFLDAESATAGVKVRLVGAVSADPVTGRLTTTFSESPQVPFSDLKLNFKTGAGALFANPPGCGAAATAAGLTPYSGQAAATPSSSFAVDQDGAGGACPGVLPFAPPAQAKPSSTVAGASTHLAVEATRADGEQTLGSLETTLPTGMLANLTGVTLCGEPAAAAGSCPTGSEIGTVAVSAGAGSGPLALSGTVSLTGPYEGRPFGLSIVVPALAGPYNLGTVVVRAAVAVDTVTGRVTVTVPSLPTIVGGVPLRLRSIAVNINRPGFVVNPTDCAPSAITGTLGSTTAALSHFSTPVQMTGCESLSFSPALTFTPTSTERDAPTGLQVDLKMPPGSSDLAGGTVQLPPGLTLNPAVASGLEACSDLQLAAGTENPVACPGAASVGTVEIATPLLGSPLTGSLYVGRPVSADPASGQEYRVFLYAQNAAYGLSVRLIGNLAADPSTGQLTVSFPNVPAIPFTDLRLDLAGGARAALANPAPCGPAAFTSTLVPVTGTDAAPGGSYAVDADGAGGACPPAAPFSPTQSAGSSPSAAAGATSFTLALDRPDGEQYISTIRTLLPAGLLGRIAAVTQCPGGLAAAGACSESSRIGSATVGVGAGPSPLSLPGGVYLTGPYEGSPFGLAVEIPAEAVGPFDYGTVVVRARIDVDEHTARVTVSSDPLPVIVGGVPLRLQTLSISTSPSFTVNPTSCTPSATETLLSSAAATHLESTPFAVAGCGSLRFAPVFTASTSAKASRAEGAPLTVELTYPGEGEANLSSVSATLPSQLPVRQPTLKLACPEATFAANPSSCPAGARVGSAAVTTPLLPAGLEGPAYLVSHAGASFPDLDLILTGDGLRLALRGETNIRGGVITTTYGALPDVPISHFTLSLPMGPNSILGAGGSLCGESLAMSTVLVAQNGARLSGSQPVAVKDCAGGESAGSAGSLSHLRVSPPRFAAASRGASVSRPPKAPHGKHARHRKLPGATITYSDARAGTVTFTVLQPATGERHGKTCRPRSPKHGRHGRKCTLYRTLGSFTHRDTAGAQRLYFTGRLHGRKLKRSSYRLQAIANYGPGVQSAKLLAAFTITG
jgi:hypothetical protein